MLPDAHSTNSDTVQMTSVGKWVPVESDAACKVGYLEEEDALVDVCKRQV